MSAGGCSGCSTGMACFRPRWQPVMRGEAEAPPALPQEIAVALHRLVARAPSRLFAVQAEDLTGAVEQINIPGTTGEHPNWRRKLGVDIEALPRQPLFRAVTDGASRGAAEMMTQRSCTPPPPGKVAAAGGKGGGW